MEEKQLLIASVTEAINQFKQFTIAHHKLLEVLYRLEYINLSSNQEKVIVLTGPTGVGKSRLVDRLSSMITKRYESEMRTDPGFIPVVTLRVPSPTGGGEFNWKDGFIRILEQLNEPLIRRKVIQSPIIELDGEHVAGTRKLVKEELRRSVRNCFKQRNTKLLIIDEASHLLISKYGSNFYQQFELIKSLSQDFGIPLLLSGAYDLLDIQEYNGQLIRRTEVIHFPRYSWAEVSDIGNPAGQSFRDAVHTFLSKIPIDKEDGLLEEMDYLYLGSLGCVGLLKDWLQDAYEKALYSHDRILTRQILADSIRSNAELKHIASEIREGEDRLKDIPALALTEILGMEEVPKLCKAVTDPSPYKSQPKQSPEKPKTRGRRPGARNPGRDKVGG